MAKNLKNGWPKPFARIGHDCIHFISGIWGFEYTQKISHFILLTAMINECVYSLSEKRYHDYIELFSEYKFTKLLQRFWLAIGCRDIIIWLSRYSHWLR